TGTCRAEAGRSRPGSRGGRAPHGPARHVDQHPVVLDLDLEGRLALALDGFAARGEVERPLVARADEAPVEDDALVEPTALVDAGVVERVGHAVVQEHEDVDVVVAHDHLAAAAQLVDTGDVHPQAHGDLLGEVSARRQAVSSTDSHRARRRSATRSDTRAFWSGSHTTVTSPPT